MTREGVERLLEHSEIIAAAPGFWAIPVGEDFNNMTYDCSQQALQIWFEEVDGRLHYFSRYVQGDGFTDQSPVYVDVQSDGTVGRWIRVRYLEERRTDGQGNLLEWRLVMPDVNTFAWQRSDDNYGGYTVVRKRCPAPGAVG